MRTDPGRDPATRPDLLQSLRGATQASHESLDRKLGALALDEQDSYTHFLSVHFAGISPLFAAFDRFVSDELAIDAPDFPEMLRADLSELGIDAGSLRRLEKHPDAQGAGLAYVIAGSRLGVAAIARGGYWGKSHECASRYMTDTKGLAIWRALVPFLQNGTYSPTRTRHACDAALAGFATFEAAFEVPAIA